MRLLLDSHILLWWQSGHRRLDRRSGKAIANADAVYVSAAVLWEIAIKTHLGRLRGSLDAIFDLSKDGFSELPVRGAHARVAAALPPHHKDPFDRMIAAQAQVEELTLVTTDDIFKAYGVRTLD